MNKKSVMIIDDDVGFLEELSEMLHLNGYTVYSAPGGEIAMEILKKNIPDIILLDLKMEHITGFQVADRLRRDKKTAGIPILAITGYFTKKEHQVPMSICGIKKCLIKPLNSATLINEIETELKKSAARS